MYPRDASPHRSSSFNELGFSSSGALRKSESQVILAQMASDARLLRQLTPAVRAFPLLLPRRCASCCKADDVMFVL